MATIQAPTDYCSFQLVVSPGEQFSFQLISNLSMYPGTSVAYLPVTEELQTVNVFLVAALNNQNPAPIALSQNVDGQRTLSMSVSGTTVVVTLYEANISTTLSVAYSLVAHWFILANVASLALAWSDGQADPLVPPAPSNER